MKKNVLSAALPLGVFACVLAMVLALGGCQRAAAPTNLADGGAAAGPSPQQRFDPAAIEAEIIKMERDWAGAAKNKDADTVRRVLADDIVITYPDGQIGTKADEVRTVETGAVTADAWEVLDPKVTVLNADSAFITGRGIIRNGKSKVPNSNQSIDISGEYRFLDVYARRSGKWQAVASQTTPIKKAP
jgi:ketosteroid isomerase-like protein